MRQHRVLERPETRSSSFSDPTGWRVRWLRLNGFVCVVKARFRKNGWRVDPASARANAGGKTRLSGVGQRPRSTAACATGHFHTEGRLRVPPDCLPLKLRPVRRAHNLTAVLLPESIVKKRTHKMDSKLANSFSYLELASCDRGFGGYRL